MKGFIKGQSQTLWILLKLCVFLVANYLTLDWNRAKDEQT